MQIQGIPEEKLFAKIEFCIRNALLKEVGTTPKPGLVDLHDTGAHKDMDYDTFVKSTYAIKPYILRMAVEGFHWNHELKNLFPHIREIGKQAEKAMFQATDGVNTHKGIIFTMGILATAAGYELKTNGHIDVIKVLDTAKEMVEDDMNRELEEMVYKDPETHGEEIYFQYGVKGIREEARSGFPVIRNTAYLKMRKYRICGYPQKSIKYRSIASYYETVNRYECVIQRKYGRTLVGTKHCTEYHKQRRSFLRSRKACDRKNEQRLYPQKHQSRRSCRHAGSNHFPVPDGRRIYKIRKLGGKQNVYRISSFFRF